MKRKKQEKNKGIGERGKKGGGKRKGNNKLERIKVNSDNGKKE